MTKQHLDKTQAHLSCHIDGWQSWMQELQTLVERRNLHLNQFSFDVRDYFSFEEAKEALVKMLNQGLYAPAQVEPTYTLVNVKTGSSVNGSIDELSQYFGYKNNQSINRLIRGGVGMNILQDWKLI